MMLFSRRGSEGSDRSTSSTSTTEYYDSCSPATSIPNSVPSLDHGDRRSYSVDTPYESSLLDSDPRESVGTYCTTVADDDDYDDYDDDDDDDENEEEDDGYGHFMNVPFLPEAVPATPQEFADLFPSGNRLIIKHDDSTLDGNMNVRVDCDADPRHRLTLFHVRMYDLRDRDFSVRRYGRDCGREVAHVKRRVAKVPHHRRRPALQRTVSKALQSFRGGKSSEDEVIRKLDRTDSGYKSLSEPDEEDENLGDAGPSKNDVRTKATNTCALEFSNYAHVDLSRRGIGSGKRYDFEYWGKSYSWKRTLLAEEASYNLVNNATGNVVARITPDPLTPEMAAIEEAKGGFVPPCSMYIENSTADPVTSSNADVADVVVTTGLVALIDDCIKRKYKTKRTVQLVLPTTGKMPLKVGMQYVGPKRFIDEMFHRRPTMPIIRSNTQTFSRPRAPPRTATA